MRCIRINHFVGWFHNNFMREGYIMAEKNINLSKQRLDALRKQQALNHEMYLNDIQLDDEIKQLKQDIALMEHKEKKGL